MPDFDPGPPRFNAWRSLMSPGAPLSTPPASSQFVTRQPMGTEPSAPQLFNDGSPLSTPVGQPIFHGAVVDDFSPAPNGGSPSSNGGGPSVAVIGVGVLALGAVAWYFLR